jgi:hypothetical protein
MLKKSRASKGGEIGINGDFYKGGEFLPSSENTVKGEFKTGKVTAKKQSKHQYEPYKWDFAPEGKNHSIYELFAGRFGRIENGKMIFNCSIQTLEYFGRTKEEINNWIELWNSGERWIE